MSGWVLAIDFGSSTTSAAYRNPNDGRICDLPLSGGTPWMPSAVFKTGEQVLVGRAAAQAAMSKPDSFEQSPQQRMVDGRRMTLDGVDVAPTDVVAAVLSQVMSRGLLTMNREPDVVVLTYPTYWSPELRARLAAAAEAAGVRSGQLRLLSEADATIGFYTAHARRLRVGTRLVSFDFGACRCNVLVLDKRADRSFTTVVGDSFEGIAGDAMDARIAEWVHRQLAANRAETVELDVARLGADRLSLLDRIRESKATLSQASWATIVVGRGAEVSGLSLTRQDFDRAIGPQIDAAITFATDIIARANARARAVAPPVIYLSGGSSMIPLVGGRLSRLGSVGRLGHPKSILCHGALELPWPVQSTPTVDDRDRTRVIAVGDQTVDESSPQTAQQDSPSPPAPGDEVHDAAAQRSAPKPGMATTTPTPRPPIPRPVSSPPPPTDEPTPTTAFSQHDVTDAMLPPPPDQYRSAPPPDGYGLRRAADKHTPGPPPGAYTMPPPEQYDAEPPGEHGASQPAAQRRGLRMLLLVGSVLAIVAAAALFALVIFG